MLRTFLVLVFPASALLADFSMEQTSQITGGAVAGMMKVAGVFSRQAREPIHTTVAVQGDRMVHLSQDHAQIIDLGKETITRVDFQKKTYSVMTFAQMKQMLDQMSQKMREKQGEGADVQFKVSVNATGQTKQIGGFDAKETILKMEMEGTDQKSGQTGAMTVISDMWLAPRVAGYQEVVDFQKRMAQKLNWTPGGNMFMARPDMAKAMAELYKQSGSLEGIPVYQVVKMGVSGNAASGANAGAAPPPSNPPQQQAEKPSVGSAVGSALGGRFGRFGGFGKKKKAEPQEQTASSEQPQSAPAQPQGDVSGALLEMTMETTNFSSAPVDSAKFEVPAGYKQIEPDERRMAR
jgi:hypothetical protein